jgi:hypothetical protein
MDAQSLDAHALDPEVNKNMDLTLHEEGDISLWIGKQKEYCSVPNFVANELSRRVAAPPSVIRKREKCLFFLMLLNAS